MATAAGDYNSLYRSLANQAGFAFASVNAVLQLEKSFFAVGVHVVGH